MHSPGLAVAEKVMSAHYKTMSQWFQHTVLVMTYIVKTSCRFAVRNDLDRRIITILNVQIAWDDLI